MTIRHTYPQCESCICWILANRFWWVSLFFWCWVGLDLPSAKSSMLPYSWNPALLAARMKHSVNVSYIPVQHILLLRNIRLYSINHRNLRKAMGRYVSNMIKLLSWKWFRREIIIICEGRHFIILSNPWSSESSHKIRAVSSNSIPSPANIISSIHVLHVTLFKMRRKVWIPYHNVSCLGLQKKDPLTTSCPLHGCSI